MSEQKPLNVVLDEWEKLNASAILHDEHDELRYVVQNYNPKLVKAVREARETLNKVLNDSYAGCHNGDCLYCGSVNEAVDHGLRDITAILNGEETERDKTLGELGAELANTGNRPMESALMVTIANLHATLLHALEKFGAPESVISALNESGDVEHVDWWITEHAPSVVNSNENKPVAPGNPKSAASVSAPPLAEVSAGDRKLRAAIVVLRQALVKSNYPVCQCGANTACDEPHRKYCEIQALVSDTPANRALTESGKPEAVAEAVESQGQTAILRIAIRLMRVCYDEANRLANHCSDGAARWAMGNLYEAANEAKQGLWEFCRERGIGSHGFSVSFRSATQSPGLAPHCPQTKGDNAS